MNDKAYQQHKELSEPFIGIKKEAGDSEIKIWQATDLFAGKNEIVIEHNRTFYRLLITKSGKLLLNK